MMMNNAEFKVRTTTEAPSELRPMTVCETAHKLYEVLLDIELKATRLNDIVFGPLPSDMCAGQPDCLESNMHMALNMANIIDQELARLIDGLTGC